MDKEIALRSIKSSVYLLLPTILGLFLYTSNLFGQVKSVVKVSVEVEPEVIRAGEILTIKTTASIEPEFHIYAINKKSEGPIASKVIINDGDVIESIGSTWEPDPVTKFDEGFQTYTHFHEGWVTFETQVKVAPNLEPGDYSLTVGLLYQACDPSICYPPRTDEVNISFTVEEGKPRKEKSELTSIVTISDDGNIDLDAVIEKGFFTFVLLAVSMGFLALLTPCVFPMIPITVSYFTKQGEISGKNPIKQATVYSSGIIATYTILGLLLAITLGASGANKLAASPWVNFFIGGLFVYFALSLFGMYEIQLPSFIRQFSLKQEGRGGYLGTLFMALTFTLTSFTCTVQFVGLLLVAAVQGDWLWPIIGMLFFSAAFALPFFFLALFPQYLARMPKSGGWLNSVKVVMGFLELAAAFKFFSNTDLVWNWGFFTRPGVLAAWVVIVFLAGLYVLGKLRLPHDTKLESVGVSRLMISFVMFTFSLYMARGLLGQPIHGLIDAYLPPVVHSGTGKIAENKMPENGVEWIMDFDEGLRLAQITGKPVFVNFTGYTCTNCRWMEANIFPLPEVVTRLKQFVLVELFTDGGPNKDINQQMEIDRFGTAALPFYVILSPDNREITRFPGLTRDKEKFLNFLDKGLLKSPRSLINK